MFFIFDTAGGSSERDSSSESSDSESEENRYDRVPGGLTSGTAPENQNSDKTDRGDESDSTAEVSLASSTTQMWFSSLISRPPVTAQTLRVT